VVGMVETDWTYICEYFHQEQRDQPTHLQSDDADFRGTVVECDSTGSRVSFMMIRRIAATDYFMLSPAIAI
jgi:hypothetical protein